MTPPDVTLGPVQLETLRKGLRLMVGTRLGRRETVEDVVQEVLARTLEAFRHGRVREPERLDSYVRGIARHVIADHFRSREREADALRTVEAGGRSAGTPSALSRVITAQELGRVRAALGALHPRDRQLLRLAFYDGLTPAEIAARLGEPGPRIRKRKSRALARLRRAFLMESETAVRRKAVMARSTRSAPRRGSRNGTTVVVA